MERARRLRKGTEFDTTYSKGTVVGSPLFAVRFVENDLERSRWGFAVGKRIAKHAVDRNRTKRRIREIARTLPIRHGVDLIIVARAPALTAKSPELRQALSKLLGRAGLLADGP